MKTVLITGSNGAIGQGLCKVFKEKEWKVIGIDLGKDSLGNTSAYQSINLDQLCKDNSYQIKSTNLITEECAKGLDVLINNAATQILAPLEKLTFQNWEKTININLNSVFILIKALLPMLEKVKGNVVNIASIHASLTKSNFSAYATSKAGLIGLTNSLAVELGSRVRVNSVCPAAIQTPMLDRGFVNGAEDVKKLKDFHPTGSIGSVDDVVRAVLFLSDDKNLFVNGTVMNLDGGIAGALHDLL
ncbi:SDR family oxidoreductase [Pelagibacteraceae bacterium]|nr:SDR family oxidoreductase [Pelagibacteraceae bacterium]